MDGSRSTAIHFIIIESLVWNRLAKNGKAGIKPEFSDGEVITRCWSRHSYPYERNPVYWVYSWKLSGYVSDSGCSKLIQSSRSLVVAVGWATEALTVYILHGYCFSLHTKAFPVFDQLFFCDIMLIQASNAWSGNLSPENWLETLPGYTSLFK